MGKKNTQETGERQQPAPEATEPKTEEAAPETAEAIVLATLLCPDCRSLLANGRGGTLSCVGGMPGCRYAGRTFRTAELTVTLELVP